MLISSLFILKETFREVRGHNQRKLQSCPTTVSLCCDHSVERSSLHLSRKKEWDLPIIQPHCFMLYSKLSLGLCLYHLQSWFMPQQVPLCKLALLVSFSCRVIIVTIKAKGNTKGNLRTEMLVCEAN